MEKKHFLMNSFFTCLKDQESNINSFILRPAKFLKSFLRFDEEKNLIKKFEERILFFVCFLCSQVISVI